ncbi:MAG: hypothetical protein M3O88_00790, partial [Actinomycetota bacterium]|nr:hypothetical protein [Actinomycetota bacterium]
PFSDKQERRHSGILDPLMVLADGDADGAPVPRFGHLLFFAVDGGPRRAWEATNRLCLVRRATDLGRIKCIAASSNLDTPAAGQAGEGARRNSTEPSSPVSMWRT